MKQFVLAAMLLGAAIVPAAAESTMDSGTSCADFLKMDDAGQMKVMEGMSMDAMAHDNMGAEGMMSDHMMSDDETSSEGMMSGSPMGSDDMMTEDQMANQTAVKACNEHPDMMLDGAMHAMDH